MRQPLFVPTARGALDVLADMRQSRVHLAVVVDEYSGTKGIITFEDLVEEIVGEIEDEHDDAPATLLRALDDGLWEADAKVELDEVGERIDPRLAEVEEDIDTLGGLAFVLAGHVPQAGTMLHHASGWIIEVTEADERHVIRLRLHPPAHSGAEEDDHARCPPPAPLRALEAFVRIVRLGSAKAAANELGLSPSALSRRVGALEDFVGKRLFTRQHQAMKLTDDGQAFYAVVSPKLEELAEAVESQMEASNVMRLHLGVPALFAAERLLPRLPDCAACTRACTSTSTRARSSIRTGRSD
jgi:hypothetical protein